MQRAQLSRPRRILLTLDAVGGVWRYAIDVARALSSSGFEIVMVGQGPRPSDDQRAELDALPATELIWIDEPLDWLADGASAIATVPSSLSAIAYDRGIDLLHLNLPSQAAGLEIDRPVVVVSHSCVVTWWQAVRGSADLPAEWEWRLEANRAGFDRADVVLAPSRSHADALTRAYGPIDGLRVVENGTSARAEPAAKQPFVLAAGRWWDEGKNGATLDRAAHGATWPIWAAGPLHGPAGQHLEFTHVVALGDQSPDAMQSLMRRAAIFAAPSLYEPFGLAVLEAAVAGAALVLADIPTFRELWGGAACFVDPCDAAGYRRAIDWLGEDEGERARLSRCAQQRAQDFTLRRQCSGLIDAYGAAAATYGRTLASVA